MPRPGELGAIVPEPSLVVAATLLVRAVLPDAGAVPVDVALSADLLEALDRQATREGPTRAAVLARAAREMVGREAA